MEAKETNRRRRFTAIGALLGFGAPLGYLALRSARERRAPSLRWLAGEVGAQPLLYGYLTLATSAVFAAFGRLLGRAVDERAAASERLAKVEQAYALVLASDLRRPIHALLLQVDALLHPGPDEGRVASRAALEGMQRSARRLDRMANQLLDATQIEVGRVTLDRRRLALPVAVAEIADELKPLLGGRPVEVRTVGAPPDVAADRARLGQVIGNLLDNAAKHGPAGRPIRVEIAPAEGGATVAVTDEGPGVAETERARLFDRVYQTRRARRHPDGLGLGLFIARGLVEAHGGRIAVESPPGRGATFRVWLPAAG